MTAPAIPEALEEALYERALLGKTRRAVSEWLLEQYGVRASHTAVQSCIACVRAEKNVTLQWLTGEARGPWDTLPATLPRPFQHPSKLRKWTVFQGDSSSLEGWGGATLPDPANDASPSEAKLAV